MDYKCEKAKFQSGRIVATRGLLAVISEEDIRSALSRHLSGDWGELPKEDRVSNGKALKEGDRLLSSYTSSNKVKFWIITEWDRSATTVLLPEEY